MAPRVSAVVLEHHEPGRIGIGEARPRLSWRVDDADPSYRQVAARLELTRSTVLGDTTTTIHERAGAEQVLVDWPAEPLSSRDRVRVRVQVCDGASWGGWSDPAEAEVGLLEPGDWAARFVGPGWAEPDGPHRRPGRVRHEFRLDRSVRRARLHLSAHGLAEVEVNGARVGAEELTPGWTSYRHRLRYATFDVTDLLVVGANALGVWLGDGWWRGRLGYTGTEFDVYGTDLAALVQLEMTMADGGRLTVASDETWTAGPGPILAGDLYDGERFDARLHDPAWSRPGFALDGWTPVRVQPLDASLLVAPTGPPVRAVEELHPVTVENRGGGRWLLDFGQNHSGRLRVRVHGPAGTTIRLRHAEVLQGGEICTETLRTAQATDELTLGGGPTRWEPRFTIHGYRYAEVSGWPGELRPGDVVSRVLHSDLRRVGWFEASDPRIRRLHENVVWSLRANFVDIPTDCPQRDERLGWTGDIQVFAPTASFLYDTTGMLASWLQDLAAEQHELGWVPPYVPYLPLPPWSGFPKDPTAVWGDAAVLTPDVLYHQTGDRDLLRRQYLSACEWLAHVEAAAGPGRICEGTVQLGDWLDPNAPGDDPTKAMTDPALVATAYFAHSARRLSVVAAALGEHDDATRFAGLADEVKAAFADRYLDAPGRMSDDTQTAYALTTAFALWPDDRSRDLGAARLAELVRASNGRIATGFAGTPVVLFALSAGGHLPEAYRLLECTDPPSWLYAVVMGGTTIWERWDSLLPDGTVYPGNMTSFNHYALGTVADWLHRVVAGIEAAAPAWRRIRFAPRPGGSLTSAAARHLTPYGEASIRWWLGADRLHVRVRVPVGADATVELPGRSAVEAGHGEHAYDVQYPGVDLLAGKGD
jgi:alpha-L-rhamnosidase